MTVSLSHPDTSANDLITLARWMARDFSNHLQSFASPKLFACIHIFFEQIYLENDSLKDAMLYAGAAIELDILKTIRLDCI